MLVTETRVVLQLEIYADEATRPPAEVGRRVRDAIQKLVDEAIVSCQLDGETGLNLTSNSTELLSAELQDVHI